MAHPEVVYVLAGVIPMGLGTGVARVAAWAIPARREVIDRNGPLIALPLVFCGFAFLATWTWSAHHRIAVVGQVLLCATWGWIAYAKFRGFGDDEQSTVDEETEVAT